MNNDNNIITDFTFKLIADFFRGIDRQGAGGDKETRQALKFIAELIADIGCGTGAQTLILAQVRKIN